MDHLQTIQQIFSARFLRVPDYQRGYAWERKHWVDLLEDLDLLDVGGEHYTGTLVLHHADGVPPITDEEGREHGVYDVVDGQRRLTTIVLLLDAIRRELPEGSTLAAGIEKTYVLTRDLDGQLRPKLRLNRDTHAFFSRNLIADHPGNPSSWVSEKSGKTRDFAASDSLVRLTAGPIEFLGVMG